MIMTMKSRAIVTTRKSLGAMIAKQFLPLEDSANDTAAQSAAFVATLLEAHRCAALPPSAGAEVIELMSEASRLALQARANVVKAHDLLRDLPQQLGIAWSEPECPPDVTGAKPALQAVA
jgi:hypothetical protein